MSADVFDREWYWGEDAAQDPRFIRFRTNVAAALKAVIAHPTDPDALDRFWANYFVRTSMPWFNETRSEGEQSVASLAEGLEDVLHRCFAYEGTFVSQQAGESKIQSAVSEILARHSPTGQGRDNLLAAVDQVVKHDLTLMELAAAFHYHDVDSFDQMTAQELAPYIQEGFRKYGNRILVDQAVEPL